MTDTDTTEDPTDEAPKLRLGGMALRNGLLVHGPTHWAAAVRHTDGEIYSASGKKPRAKAFDNVPGARGVVRLGESMVVIPLVRKNLPQARLPFESATVLGTMAATSLATQLLRRNPRARGAVGEALIAGIGLAPSLIALRSGELAAYHGAEHKAIGAYERGDADARDHSKEHDRCGSHLMTPLLAFNIAGAALLRKVVKNPGQAEQAAVAVASIGAAVEVFAWAERHHDSVAARALRVPGHELQRALGTREPDDAQLEVGRAALAEILRAEGAA
ncbi:MAG: DUF1385 domain-containing protein, partial [Solirubrobacteraceae bacterium]|nr:DUF1385 domain-containing protein [Solirubrobacteraceae bacterium]